MNNVINPFVENIMKYSNLADQLLDGNTTEKNDNWFEVHDLFLNKLEENGCLTKTGNFRYRIYDRTMIYDRKTDTIGSLNSNDINILSFVIQYFQIERLYKFFKQIIILHIKDNFLYNIHDKNIFSSNPDVLEIKNDHVNNIKIIDDLFDISKREILQLDEHIYSFFDINIQLYDYNNMQQNNDISYDRKNFELLKIIF